MSEARSDHRPRPGRRTTLAEGMGQPTRRKHRAFVPRLRENARGRILFRPQLELSEGSLTLRAARSLFRRRSCTIRLDSASYHTYLRLLRKKWRTSAVL